MSKKRKYHSPAERVSILRRHFIEKVSVSALCDEYGIHPTLFYKWQQVFFERGATAFESKQDPAEKQMARKLSSLETK